MEICRTFIGIPLKVDSSFLEGRKDLIHALEGERISWVQPGNFHLTIRFLGNQPGSKVSQIRSFMERDLDLPPARTLNFTYLGTFGQQQSPKVLWVGLEDVAYLKEIRKEVDHMLGRCGFGGEGKDYRPHLTLGRIRGLAHREAFHRSVEAHSSNFHSSSRAEQVVLFQSELKSTAAVYTPLTSIDLQV